MQAKNKPKLRNWKSTDDRMALKSNAFAPKTVALGGRQLVDDHMTAHYNRLRNARPSVDTSTPKAMLSDVRVRDRDKKEGSLKRRPFSAVTLARDSGQDDKGHWSYEGRRRADSARTLPAWKPAGIYGLSDPSGAIPVQSRSQKKMMTEDVEKKLLDEKGGTEEVQDERVDGNGDKDDVESFMASHRSLTSLGRVSEFHEQRLDETLKKQQNEDKELLYLEFISDLTNDILTRGIYSNRALQLVFESHMQRRKNELDERIMREKVKQLEEDLGIV
ncbi:uncharacterized protein [Oscarella lobularis]|uniref:uncharacterized protein isoform X2 n=1 Tax=Oscarella lobularis TaxID=121494 RepID=UPI0033138BF5